MQGVLKRLGLLLVISLSLMSRSGLVMAQDDSTLQAPSTIQDPCWPLAYPPDSPADDSLHAGIEYRVLQLANIGGNYTGINILSHLIDASPENASLYVLRGCLYARLEDEQAAIDNWKTFIDLSDDEAQIAEVEKLIAIYSGDEMKCYKEVYHETQREARLRIDSYDLFEDKANYHNLRGLAYLCLGYYDLGLYEFEIALNLVPSSGAFYNNRGLAYSALADYEKAIADYNYSLELDPNDPSTLSSRGLAYVRMGKYNEALADYTRVIELNPDDPDAYDDRGRVYMIIKDYDEAIADLTRALEIDPTYIPSLSQRALIYQGTDRYAEALEDYEILLELSPTAEHYYDRGLAYLDMELYGKALDDFLVATEGTPESANYWNGLTMAYFRLMDIENALKASNRAIELDPSFALALEWRAFIYYSIDDYGECVTDYTALLAMEGPSREDPPSWMRRGVCYDALGQGEEAVRDYEKAIALETRESYALTYRGVAYRSQEQYSEAISSFNHSIELNDTYDYAWMQRGVVYYELGEYEKALDDYNQAVELNPDRTLTYLYRAYAYYTLKDYDHAQEDFEMYLKLVPDTRRREEIENLLEEMAVVDS
jgi:tetratricopeptide (TPR) repeat protein